MKLDAESLAKRIVPPLVRAPRAVLVAAALLTVLGVVFSARLYADLRSDVEELLPADAPSVVAARSIGPKVHNVTHLSIVLEGKDGDAIEKFADDLAVKLRAMPKDQVQSVDYRIDEDEAFYRHFGGLFLDLPDLKDIAGQLDARIAWEKHHAAQNALDLVGETDDTPAPKLDFSNIEKKFNQAAGAKANFRNGYYQTPDGKILAMLVRPPELATGYTSNKALLDTVRSLVEELHPEKYDPALKVGFDGDVASLVEEQEALIEDLASSTAVVLIFVTLALWLYFRRWSAILAISLALAASTALTFGAAFFLVGHLNANTAFLGSIVLGNGINVSIIFVARYLEERRRAVEVPLAIERAWGGTLTATFVASFGAGLAYLSLASTNFRGFSQFGEIGGLGMALCWVGAYLLLPPLLATIDGGSAAADLPPPHKPVFGNVVANLVERHTGIVRGLSAALLVLSFVGVLTYKGDLIEYDPARLRSQKSIKVGAVHWGTKVDEVFKAYLTPIAVRAETPEDLDKFVAALDARRRARGNNDPVREVHTLRSMIPSEQDAKLPILAHIREQLTDARIALLDPELQKKARLLKPPADLKAVTLADLPATTRLQLTERDGSSGRIALVFPSFMGSMGPKELDDITGVIRGAIADANANAMAVGQALLFGDIAKSILSDGPKATVLAFGLVCLLVILGFRKAVPTLHVLAALVLGVAWLVGWAAFAQVRLNFLNFVVLPITFGIGVDYAANIVQRQRLEGPGSLARVLRETGGAVALCSATTIIGYASLLVADSRALAGFGLLASLGEIACLTAALLALPAWVIRGLDASAAAAQQPTPNEPA